MDDIQLYNAIISVEIRPEHTNWGVLGKGKGIRPYSQAPATTEADKDRLCPHSLFFIFTAEIIKKNVVFTR